MKMKKKLIIAFMLTIAVFTLAACSDVNKSPDAGITKVRLILDYKPNTNHTGFYVAEKLGYFEEEGLSVEIIEPADNTVTTLIATGKGEFGISYQEDVTYARALEQPLPVKAIATVIQHNTSGFATYKDKNILTPREFEGKVYAGWGSPSEEAVLKAVIKADGGDPNKITYVVSDGSGFSALKDKVDIMWFFWAWDGISAQMAGLPVNYIELKQFDERLDYYTPVIIANDSLLKEDPELVRAFLRAAKKGYEYAIEKPYEAAEILYESTPEYNIEMLKASQSYLAKKYSEDAESWGIMKQEVWQGYTEFMLENDLIQMDVPALECYTNDFLD